MSLVVHKLVLSPGGATATTQPPTAHHVTLSAYTHARSNAKDSMGRVLDGPPSGSMSTPPASSSPYSSSSSNSSSSSSSSSKHSSTYNLPFVLQDHNYGAPPPPTPPHSPPPLPSTSSISSSSNTSSSSGSTYQHHHHHQQQQQQQQHQYHHHHHHHHLQTYQSTTLAPSLSSSSSSPSTSSSTTHHHTSSSTTPHHHHHHPTTTTTITAPHHHHHPTTAANPHHHQQQQHQHHPPTTTSTTPHLQQKHHHFLQHPGPSPRLGSSSSCSASSSTSCSTTSSSSTSNTHSSSAASFSSPPLSVGGVMTHHPLTNMPPHRQQFMPHPKSSIIFPSPHIPPPPVELSPHHPHHHQSPPSSTAGPPPPLLPSTETDDDSRLSDRSSSVGPSGEETETAPEGEGDDLPADDSITRCVCDFSHDDGYMIQCDHCFVWQHVDCMEIDRDNIPDEYLCEACDPRPIDRFKARALQIRRRQEIKAHLARLSSSDSEDNIPMSAKSRGNLGKVQERKVVKKKKVKQIKDMKNGRKGSSGGSGSLSLLKKSGGGSNNTTTTISCNNSLLPSQEDKDRRMLVKRRRKSNSLSGGEGVSDDSSGGPVERLRAWVEGYEAAVTNHYSPELRARVHAARINGVSPDLRASTQGAVLGHRCRVANNPRPLFDVFDSKILVAATRLSPNTAITEFQGKYLLASQWNAQQSVSSQPYMPYVLQYHMPKEGLTVCVDARTYGNDARFTRHSCTPNAEVRHVVERGSLHLYIVASREIEEGEEVTLAMETANSTLELVCCLAEEHDCQAPPGPRPEQAAQAPALAHKKNGLIVGNKKALKKQQLQLQLRTSKRTTSSDTRLMESAATTPVNPSTPVSAVKQRRASGCGKSPVKSPSTASLSSSPEEGNKDISSNPVSGTLSTATGTVTVPPDTPCTTMDKQQQQKMTREERKIAAYMKAFERLEKAAQRRQEMEKKKEEDKGKEVREPKEKEKKRCDGDEEDWEKTSSADECARSMAGADRCRRKGKKGRGKGSPQKRSNHRADSAASDLTGDESSCASVGLMSPSGGATLENIALNFNSPPQGNPNAMGFRFPKTKKALMNEWLNENVDPVVPVGSVVGTDLPSGVPPCYMRSPAMPLRRSSLNQTTGPGVLPVQDMSGGSAKKRWLRQAISEETETPQFNGLCPSPNSRPDSPTGGGDYITPLKKRRLARESMSSELSSTPPSTPVHSTSLEEDKMVEEMEAELAEEEDSPKIKSNHRYSEDHQPTSPSAQGDTTCTGFLRSATDISSATTSRMKRVVVQEDGEEEEEDLVIDEGGSFFDQGSGAVNFSKVAVCGRLSQGQAEEQHKEEKGKGRGVTRGKSRRGKVCYEPQEEEEGEEEEEEDELDEREEHEEEKKQSKIDYSRGEPVKCKRRQNAGKKARSQQQQQAAKRGRKQQGVTTKKGRQEVRTKTEVKRRKSVKRGKEELPVKKEEEEKKVEMEEEEEKKLKVADDQLQSFKEEPYSPEIKTEAAAESKTETECKVQPKSEIETQEEQEIILSDGAIKKEEKGGEQVVERKELEVKTETQDSVDDRIDNTVPHQEMGDTTENKTEVSDSLKDISKLDRIEDDRRPNEIVSKNQDQPPKKKEEEEEDRRTPNTDEVERAEAKQSSEDNQELLHSTIASSEAPPREARGAVDGKDKTVEESAMSGAQGQTKKAGKKKVADKASRKVKKPRRPLKKVQESKQKQKAVKESWEKLDEKEGITSNESRVQNAETEKGEKDTKSDPVLEKRDDTEHCISSRLREHSKSPSLLISEEKGKDEGSSTQEPPTTLGKTTLRSAKEGSLVQCDRRAGSQTPTRDVDTTSLHAKTDSIPVITLEARWKLDMPLKPEEHTMEVSRKPPTPPTLFPPLPWQTNPETFSENNLRPKTPESSNYVGVRGPRTPEGPAPTSPSDPTMSPPSSPPRSPLTNLGDSEEMKSEERRVGESTMEKSWRSRARGPCTPPSPPPQEATQEEEQQQEGSEEASSSPSHHHPPSNPESTQTRPAPVKKKLSILEYRKRKSVGGEAGPLDSSPPPCPPPHRTLGGDSSGGAHESSVHGGPHSPSQSSPPGLTGSSRENGDSSPDLPLSPVGPILLPSSPINFDTRSSVEETKREGESYCSSATGIGGGSDLSRHSIINKIISSNNNGSNNNSSSTTTTNSSSNISGSCAVSEATIAFTVTTNAATTITATHTLHPITGGNTQEVKWNAAPTLLERQRENLTARLRREFGLCVADDDDDKSGLRLGCSGVLSRPSPPMLPSTPHTTASGPLSPRVRKPPSLAVGSACVSYLAEGDERGHHRKNLPPPPPPPPPPSTAPPKNSIFQGREVTVQKVTCGIKAGVPGTAQPAGGTTGGAVVSNSQRLLGSSGLFSTPTTTPPVLPGIRGGSSSQGTAPASPGIPSMLSGAVPRPCPVPPPIGVPPVPSPPVVQAGLAVLPAVARGLPGLPPSKQPGHCLTPALAASQQNPEYPGRSFPRGQFGAPGMGSLSSPISLYSAARLGPPPPPPPPPPLPPQTDPAGPGLRGPSPPGHVDPARVGGEGGVSYSGQDCPAPGTRGS